MLYTMLLPSIASAEIFISFIAVQVWGVGGDVGTTFIMCLTSYLKSSCPSC